MNRGDKMNDEEVNKKILETLENAENIGNEIVARYINDKDLTGGEILEVYCALKLVIKGLEDTGVIDEDYKIASKKLLKMFEINATSTKVKP